MTDTYLAQPDLGFIAQIRGLGGDTLKNVTSARPVPWHALFLRRTARFPEKR